MAKPQYWYPERHNPGGYAQGGGRALLPRSRSREPKGATTNRLLLGALAGLAGTVAMTAAMRAMHRHLPSPERYPLPPREIVQRAVVEPSGRALSEQGRRDATLAAHFGYGAATGALYGLARPSERIVPGALYGVLVWAGSYLGWIPALGILRPAARHPLRRNGLMIAAHLVWGATLAATLRELERAEAEIFASDAVRGSAPDAAIASGRPKQRS